MLSELLLCVYPCAGATSMYLVSEHIHPCKDAGGSPPTAGYASTSATTRMTLQW